VNFVESGNPSEDIPAADDFDVAEVLMTLSLIGIDVAGELLLLLLPVLSFIRIVVGLRTGAETEEVPEVTSVMEGCCCCFTALFGFVSETAEEVEFPDGATCKEEVSSTLFARGRKIIVSESWRKSCADDDGVSCCGEPRRPLDILVVLLPSLPCNMSKKENKRMYAC
jgi:hypothetical protein